MSIRIQSVRGMHDLLPEQSAIVRYIENKISHILNTFGYREIRTPIIEQTELFKRSIGEVTDIVEKEMYTFEDRGGDSLTLRPEGTASCVRAGIQHGLFNNQHLRIWYMGPFFRYERPQKGRYRQFHQIGVETFGVASADIDAELIAMLDQIWSALDIKNKVSLQLNSLGTFEARNRYRLALIEYFKAHAEKLDEDSKRRLTTNPLRILDSKNPELTDLIHAAPRITNYLDDDSQAHLSILQELLRHAGIEFTINERLVRGLDYYTKTVFEWVCDGLGAQSTVCAGGRYDGLVEQLGGNSIPAAGFAIGLERLAEIVQPSEQFEHVDLYLVLVGDDAQKQGLRLSAELHKALSNCVIVMNCDQGSMKTQIKRADRSGALLAIILGDTEVSSNKITVKFLREDKPQETIKREDLISFLHNALSKTS